MLRTKRNISLHVDEEYIRRCAKQLTDKYDEVGAFYRQLTKAGLIKVINKGWLYDPNEYDFTFRVKSDVVDQEDFVVLCKSTMVDLIKLRKIIQYIIIEKLTYEN